MDNNYYYEQNNNGSYYEPPRIHSESLGIASLIMGIISVFFFMLSFTNVIFGIIAIVFGCIQLGRNKTDGQGKKLYPLVGIITSIVGITFSVLFVLLAVRGFFKSGLADQINNSQGIYFEYGNPSDDIPFFNTDPIQGNEGSEVQKL